MDIGTQDDDYKIVTKPEREANPYELPARPEVTPSPVEVPSK